MKTEADGLDPDPPESQRRTLDAIRYLERAVVDSGPMEGIALRYGVFYGPGTAMADLYPELIRKRKLPVVGDGAGVWSFVRIDDAAAATVAALEHGEPGVYNVVDDEPAPVSEWPPFLAEVLDAPRPRHLPVWLARLVVGEAGVSMMTQVRGSSNARAKRALGWAPLWKSWRDGFRNGLGDVEPVREEEARAA